MDFSEKVKSFIEKSIDSSKDFIAKAGSQAQVWSVMGKLKFEIIQLRSQAQNLMTQLGTETYRLLVEKNEPMIGSSTQEISPLLTQLQKIEQEIAEKEGAFRAAGGKDADLDGDGKPD